MIQRLQKKLTLLILACVFILVSGIVVSVNTVNWLTLCSQAETSLQALMDNEGQRPKQQSQDRPREKRARNPAIPSDDRASTASLGNSYTLRIDHSGALTEWTSDRADLYDDTQVQALAAQIAASGQTSGRIGTQFFLTRDRPYGMLVVVLDARMEVAGARTLLSLTLLIGLLAFTLMGASAFVLAHRLVYPVQEAFDKQRQFIWDASHELKTPLAVISANADVLAGELGENPWLGYIQSEIRRTDRLVQNLLTLARLDRDAAQAAFSLVDLSQIVLSVALPFESAVYEADKTMRVEVDDGLFCPGNADMLSQLTVILLDNAVKYASPGGTITLSLHADGRHLLLRVHNTGEGIAPEDRERIFDRFYRCDASHSSAVPGNGLGLSIARRIADAHHAEIRICCPPGQGTAFTVLLPRQQNSK